jgi:hypothetical protein
MAARDLLKYQTRLLSTLREIQNGMSKVLGEQGEVLGGMVLAVIELQGRVSRMDHSVMANDISGASVLLDAHRCSTDVTVRAARRAGVTRCLRQPGPGPRRAGPGARLAAAYRRR